MQKVLTNEKTLQFIKIYYQPVEDKPGYVWFSKKDRQIIKIDVLKAALENLKTKIEKIENCKEDYEDNNVQNDINLISKEEFDKMYDINNGFNNTYPK